MSATGSAHPNAGLPPGVSFEEAEKIAQVDMATIRDLVGRFKANKILPLQSEFITFFVELPEDAWLALRQAMIDAKIPVRDIDNKVKAKRLQRLQAASRDWRRSVCFKVAVDLKAAGATYEAVCEALFQHLDPEVAKWAHDIGEHELRGIYDAASVEKVLALSDFVAFMTTHEFIFKPTGDLWPASSVDARVPPIEVVDRDGNPVLGLTGTPKLELASEWLSGHAPVEQMVWAPGEPQIITNKLLVEGGWIDRPGSAAFNVYIPAPPLPAGADAAKAGPWLDHIRRIYPNEADHIVRFLAHRVQRPQEKINHCLVLGGPQGIGKDTLLEAVRRAVGPWNFQEVSPQQTTGRFNGYLKSVVLRISEAKDLGEVDRFKFYDHTKIYFAAPPDTLRIDEKHRREYSALNVCSGAMTTNHQTDGIFLPADDRRHYVAWSEAKQEDFTAEYWNKLWRWYEDGGFGHVTAYLQALDLSDFDPKAPPPKTAAFWAIVDANRPAEDADLSDLFDGLGRPPVVTLDSLIEQAAKTQTYEIMEWLRERKNRRVILFRLETCGYVPVRNDAAKDGLFKVGTRRKAIYARSDLTLRDRFTAAQTLAGARNWSI
jgi:DNA polymerase III delta prime subunit